MIATLLALTAVALTVLVAWRWSDRRADQAVWASLASHQPADPEVFEPAVLTGLPEPAQRYFRFAIRPAAALYTVAEISMDGDFSLGSKAEPNYMPMHAKQILAAPYGFVWKLRAGKWASVSGSDGSEDGKSWSRFWLLGIAPVARTGGNADHSRSAFGRYVAEAVIWTPAALLPGKGVQWEPIDHSTARVILSYGDLEQAVDLSVDADGRLTTVSFQRWSDANPDKSFQLQPFGGTLSEYREFGAYRLPTRIDAGNFFGTDEYFPFFRANVSSVRFPTQHKE